MEKKARRKLKRRYYILFVLFCMTFLLNKEKNKIKEISRLVSEKNILTFEIQNEIIKRNEAIAKELNS